MWMGLSVAAAGFGLSWLFLILGGRCSGRDFSGLSLAVFTKMTPPPGSRRRPLERDRRQLDHDGRSASSIGAPLGMLAGTYLAEYGRYAQARLRRSLHQRHSAQRPVDRDRPVHLPDRAWRRWAISPASPARIALAVIVVPVVVRTTEDMLNLVPNSLREAGAALGMPRSLVIQRIAYRAARSRPVDRRAAGGRAQSAAKPRRCCSPR